MSAIQIFEDIAPEFAGLDSSLIIRIESLASSQLKQSVFGDLYDYAVALLMAHIFTIRNRSGSSGQVSAVKEGQLGINYAGSQDMTQWEVTSYGAELKALIKRTVLGASTARSR